jgi:3-hydroxyacyl-[acyl-carrier-protein] dehydratase
MTAPRVKPDLGDLPHRPPFRFVDEVVECDERRIVARTRVAADAEYFRGHYPGHPVMPGVLICECAFQAGALLLAHRRGAFDPARGLPILTRINDARFRRVVRPGDTLEVEVELDSELEGACYMTARVRTDGRLVLRVTFAVIVAPLDSGDARPARETPGVDAAAAATDADSPTGPTP